MKIALVQYDPAWEDRSKNRSKIEALLHSFKNEEADWLVFPEMTLSGFSMNVEKTTLDREDRKFFEDIARATSAFVTFGGVVDRSNVCITLNQSGTELARYSKIQLFTPAGEHSYYKPGTKASLAVVEQIRFTQNICYDLRFANLFWRHAADTDLFVVIANWPASRRAHWRTLLQARAIENQAFVVGVNRIGNDPKVAYSGDSMIIAPDGQIVLDCGDKEGIFAAEISPVAVNGARQQFPFLKDRKGEPS